MMMSMMSGGSGGSGGMDGGMKKMQMMMQMMEMMGGASSGSGGGSGDVEEFIQSNMLDDRAADALREESPQVQQKVMSRGNLHGTRNASSALMMRIRDARR